jgi:hypothetical protein
MIVMSDVTLLERESSTGSEAGVTGGAAPLGTPVLADEERQVCEVWTRVMGYHRPVASFNRGKQGEYAERVCFAEPTGRVES